MIHIAVPNLTGNEKKYLDDCIDSTFVSSVGKYVSRLEDMVTEATGSSGAAATSSGTTGLHAALTAIGVKRDELVIIPSFTFIATANAVSQCGAVPWCMDISDENWCIDPYVVQEELRCNTVMIDGHCIHKDTGMRVAAIMPVYVLGNIPDMMFIREIAGAYNLSLVADAACAIGSTLCGRPMGDFADVSILSFNGNKTITCGGGGMVFGTHTGLIDKIKHLTATARIGTEYDFDMIGFNYRMTNIQAAVGCAQMERLEEFVKKKKYIRHFYNERLINSEIKGFPETPGSSCWFSGIVLPEPMDIDDVRSITEKLRSSDIEGRTFWKPVHLQSIYSSVPRSHMAVTDSIWGKIVTLPCSTDITDEELEYTVGVVKDILREKGIVYERT